MFVEMEWRDDDDEESFFKRYRGYYSVAEMKRFLLKRDLMNDLYWVGQEPDVDLRFDALLRLVGNIIQCL